MNIHEAVAASSYDGAAAYYRSGHDIIVEDGDVAGRYDVKITLQGGIDYEEHAWTLDEVEQRYPNLNWWPIREDGDWGDEVEAKHGGN